MANFKRRSPCKNCPFRTDIEGYLRRERAQEIAQSLAMGAEFPCHETTVPDPEDDSELIEGPKSQFCAGALIMMENMGVPNQAARIAERLDMYDAEKLDMDAPVVKNAMEFIDHHSDEEPEEYEACSIAEFGCEAPAGYMLDGVVVPANDPGETRSCEGCGEPVCENCFNGYALCPYCRETI